MKGVTQNTITISEVALGIGVLEYRKSIQRKVVAPIACVQQQETTIRYGSRLRHEECGYVRVVLAASDRRSGHSLVSGYERNRILVVVSLQ